MTISVGKKMLTLKALLDNSQQVHEYIKRFVQHWPLLVEMVIRVCFGMKLLRFKREIMSSGNEIII